MNGHPGGREHTLAMLRLSGLMPAARILDMGAGAGESVRLLQEQGFRAEGIDLCPRGEQVEKGDFLSCPYPDGTFDAVLSQCAFYVSGDAAKAFREAARVLKQGGLLLLSDVRPAERDLVRMAEDAGFATLVWEDLTGAWKEYYIEAIWRGTAQCLPTGKKYCYDLLIARKE